MSSVGGGLPTHQNKSCPSNLISESYKSHCIYLIFNVYIYTYKKSQGTEYF